MYTRYFGFKEKPFDLSPDPKFLYLSEGHKEALAHLKYAARERKGFVVITGEVGTGKTTLLNALLEELDPKIKRVHLTDPGSTVEDLFYMIKKSLDLPVDDVSKGKILWALNDFMRNRLPENEQVLLIIDEAQRLSSTMLEEIRLLSNIETSSKRLFQIFLVGQQELNVKLQAPELRQLYQRIGVKYHLTPLNLKDTQNYIMHRLEVAGFTGNNLFHPRAIKEIHRFSKGYPRLINILCDNALLTAYSRDLKEIKRNVVKEIIKDTEASYGIPKKRVYTKVAFAMALIFLLAALTYAGYKNRDILEIPSQWLTWIHKKYRSDVKIGAPAKTTKAVIQEESVAKENIKTESVSDLTESKQETAITKENLNDTGPSLKSKEKMDEIHEEVLFDFDDYEIGPEAIETLKKVASAIQHFPGALVIIEGHTDNFGDHEKNQLLSEQRAESVKQWLIDHAGIEESRFKLRGWGADKPKFSNDTLEGRRKNRRVEITIRGLKE